MELSLPQETAGFGPPFFFAPMAWFGRVPDFTARDRTASPVPGAG